MGLGLTCWLCWVREEVNGQLSPLMEASSAYLHFVSCSGSCPYSAIAAEFYLRSKAKFDSSFQQAASLLFFFFNPFPWSAKTFSIEHWLTRKFFCQLNNLFFMGGRGFFSEPSATTNKGFSLWYYLHSHHCSLLTWASFKELEVIFNKGQNIFTLNLYLAKETFLQWPPVNSVHCRIYWGILVTLVVFFIPRVLKSPEERVDQ